MKRFAAYVLPIGVYMGLIFLGSSQTELPTPQLPGFDKLSHFIEYAILGVLVARAFGGYGVTGTKGALLAIGLCALYGATDELHQRYTPNRVPDLVDWVSDTLGAVTGAWAWRGYRRRIQSRSR